MAKIFHFFLFKENERHILSSHIYILISYIIILSYSYLTASVSQEKDVISLTFDKTNDFQEDGIFLTHYQIKQQYNNKKITTNTLKT